MNIILIGMPGCGKSTVGVVLAKAAGYNFMDTDLLIQQREKMRLQQIIDTKGLPYFLKAEEDALLSVTCDYTVIATGGSAIYSPAAMEHLKAMGAVVYLQVAEPEIERRLSNLATRGVAGAKDKTMADIYNERIPLYEKYADFTVTTGAAGLQRNAEKIMASL